jgi:hypothetical protein
MEGVMLGSKRSVSLWKQRRPQILPLEQSLAAAGTKSAAASSRTLAKAIKVGRTRGRVAAESRKLGRFAES